MLKLRRNPDHALRCNLGKHINDEGNAIPYIPKDYNVHNYMNGKGVYSGNTGKGSTYKGYRNQTPNLKYARASTMTPSQSKESIEARDKVWGIVLARKARLCKRRYDTVEKQKEYRTRLYEKACLAALQCIEDCDSSTVQDLYNPIIDLLIDNPKAMVVPMLEEVDQLLAG